jgi:hypothetical protein
MSATGNPSLRMANMDGISDFYSNTEAVGRTRIGTPDPTKYHDISSVRLESDGSSLAAVIPHTGAVSGTIIPRATRDGGSRGRNHMKAAKAFIDPVQTNNRLVMDPEEMMARADELAKIVEDAYAEYSDPQEAAVAAFTAFARAPKPTVRETPPKLDIPIDTPPAPTSFTKAVPASFTKVASPPPAVQPFVPEVSVPAASRVVQSARSLREQFGDGVRVGSTNGSQPTRKVTFELPTIGQFPCLFHSVIYHEDTLVLVYDHSYPSQSVWFPPVLENPETGAPTALAVLVEGTRDEPSRLYLAFPTGVRFPFESKEFCILTVDKVKEMNR